MSVHHLMRPDKLPGQLSFHSLHAATADANQCCHLEYAIPRAQMLPDRLLQVGRHLGRPSFFPCWHTRSRPARTLLRIISRSCSPKTDAIWIKGRPIGVVLSIACRSE